MKEKKKQRRKKKIHVTSFEPCPSRVSLWLGGPRKGFESRANLRFLRRYFRTGPDRRGTTLMRTIKNSPGREINNSLNAFERGWCVRRLARGGEFCSFRADRYTITVRKGPAYSSRPARKRRWPVFVESATDYFSRPNGNGHIIHRQEHNSDPTFGRSPNGFFIETNPPVPRKTSTENFRLFFRFNLP